MIKAVLFDLDGTLLPMDQDEFTRGYFKLLAKKLTPHGYEPEPLIRAIWHGTKAMVKNDGSRSNEAAFWDDFAGIYGEAARKDEALFLEFYTVDFAHARKLCGCNPKAAEAVHLLKDRHCRVALATNPIFPAVATEARVRWAGLSPEDFELCTTYENIGHCKPNPDYYREILRRMELAPEDCLMVGNDVGEDMIAEKLGMKVFLMTDCLINPSGEDIACYPNGNIDDLLRYLREVTA
ncbi:MAG: HAD family hydrolase [Oscillospiraceae bacterium]|nr:HAD family hydrolase [Oscillospiraceae bacterium]